MPDNSVLITGATSTLGKEIAFAFAEKSFNLILLNHNNTKVKNDIKNILETKYPSIKYSFFSHDLRDHIKIKDFIKEIEKKTGIISCLVNNAAITINKPFVKVSDEDFANVYDINLKAVFNITRLILKQMVKKRTGHIISISSIQALNGGKGIASYAAAKAGLIAFSKSIAKEYGPFNIKSNIILPGYFKSNMTNNNPEHFEKKVANENCLKKINDPEEVAKFIVFLSQMKNVSGQVFNLDSRII